MRLRVYHNPDFLSYRANTAPKLADCVAVAELEANTIDDGFALTNTIEEYWWKNGVVASLFEGEDCRSTSTGDVIMNLDTNEIWVVQMFGYIKGDADGNVIQS